MSIKTAMKDNNISTVTALSLLLIFIITACAQSKEPVTAPDEDFIETGILVVESSPVSAQVFVDGNLEGESPVTLYNFPVGLHYVVVKKEGYADFEKEANVKVGLTEEVDARLVSLESREEALPEEEIAEEVPQTIESNRIKLSSFAMYHDFDNNIFTETRSGNSDIFTRKYDNYVDIVALAPARIGIVSISLGSLKRIDCINSNNPVAQIYPEHALCVVSAEGDYFGLRWDSSTDELEWVELV